MNDSERDKTLYTSGVNHLPLPRGKYKVGSILQSLCSIPVLHSWSRSVSKYTVMQQYLERWRGFYFRSKHVLLVYECAEYLACIVGDL